MNPEDVKLMERLLVYKKRIKFPLSNDKGLGGIFEWHLILRGIFPELINESNVMRDTKLASILCDESLTIGERKSKWFVIEVRNVYPSK